MLLNWLNIMNSAKKQNLIEYLPNFIASSRTVDFLDRPSNLIFDFADSLALDIPAYSKMIRMIRNDIFNIFLKLRKHWSELSNQNFIARKIHKEEQTMFSLNIIFYIISLNILSLAEWKVRFKSNEKLI